MPRSLLPAVSPRVHPSLFSTSLPLCVEYSILYYLSMRINTTASGFLKSQATAAPFPPLSFCVLFVRLSDDPTSLLCRRRLSDLLPLCSCSTLQPSAFTSPTSTAFALPITDCFRLAHPRLPLTLLTPSISVLPTPQDNR